MASAILMASALLLVVNSAFAMSTCNKDVAKRVLNNTEVKGSYLKDLAGKEFWMAVGTTPDREGIQSIFLVFGELCKETNSLVSTSTRHYKNGTSVTFNIYLSEGEDGTFFWTGYPEGMYKFYHYSCNGLLVLHRCIEQCITGTPSFSLNANIEMDQTKVEKALDGCISEIKEKFPDSEFNYLEFPEISSSY